jgi:hypothetical protein
MDMKKLQAFAGGKDKKGPFPPKMKGYGKKGMHAPIVGKDDKEEDMPEGDGEEQHHDVDVDAIAAEIEAGTGDKHLAKMMKGYDDEEQEMPSFIEDEDLWDKAKEMVDPENCDFEHPWLVTAAVYAALGGEMKMGNKGFPKKDSKEHEDKEADPDDDEDEDDEDDE